MFLRPNDENRGRIVSAMLSQLADHSHPTLSIDVQMGTHFSSGISGRPREAFVHGAAIQVHGEDLILPFLAQLLANGVPVALYPGNGWTEEQFAEHCQRRVEVIGKETL